jgi:hypothetical protein
VAVWQAGIGRVNKQTAEQTIDQTVYATKTDDCRTKSDSDKKTWTALATDLKKRWFAEMRKRKVWIYRKEFLIEFFSGTEGSRGKWNGLTATTEDRRFQDNPNEWKTESEALKTQFKNRR